MTMDQQEKDRLAQVGKDRKLAEAVDNLDLMASTFVKVAGDSNSTDETIIQAATDYRAAVDRRNAKFDESAGVTRQPGDGAPPAAAIDENRLVELIRAEIAEALAAAGTAPEPPAGDAGKGNAAAGSGEGAQKTA